MTELQQLLCQIERTRDCKVAAPSGQPVLREVDRLPDDLAEFYRLAGGATLFEHGTYPIRVVGPGEFVRANPEIVGSDCPGDMSDGWYIVARGGREEAITRDCNADRLGRCYDSFWDRHGVAGDCRIVALSFTELLQRLFDSGGGYWYWLGVGAPGYGDAYGGEMSEASCPMSKNIPEALRDQQRSLKASQLATLLEEMLGRPLDQGSFVFKFKEAFPEIPLRRLTEASGWSRLCVGGFDDNEFDEMLAPWLGLDEQNNTAERG